MSTVDAIGRPEGVSQKEKAGFLFSDKWWLLKDLELVKEQCASFGDRMPQELYGELKTIESRLKKA